MHYMERAFATHEELARVAVLQETWGHLYPETDTEYIGTIDIAVDGHSEYVVVDWDLINANGDQIDSSPVFYEHSNNFACDQCPINVKGRPAGLYRFTITYEWTESGGNFQIHSMIKAKFS